MYALLFRIIPLLLWTTALLTIVPLSQAQTDPILVIDPHGHSADITAIMVSPDKNFLISVSLDKTVRFWEVNSGDLKHTFRIQVGEGIQGMLHSGAISPDGALLALAGWPAEPDQGIPVYLIDLNSHEMITVLNGHQDVITALSFSGDGDWLVSAGDTTAQIWDIANIQWSNGQSRAYRPVLVLNGHSGGIHSALFTPDGKRIITAGYDNYLNIYTLSADKQNVASEITLKAHQDGGINGIAVNSQGSTIASIGGDYKVQLWNIDGSLGKSFTTQTYPLSVSFSPSGKRLVVGGTPDAPSIVLDVSSGRTLSKFSGHDSHVLATSFIDDHRVVTAGGDSKQILIWDADSGTEQKKLVGMGRTVWSIGFGPELTLAMGKQNTSLGNVNPGSDEFSQLAQHPHYVPLEFSFDFKSMQLTRQVVQPDRFKRSVIKTDENSLERVSIDLLKLADGTEIKNPKHGSRWIRSYTFAGMDRVAAGFDALIRIYGTDGSLIHELSGHTGAVWALSSSEDGRLLASASDDQTVKIWDLEKGTLLVSLFVTEHFEWVCWTPDGYYTASAGGESFIGYQVNNGVDSLADYYPLSVFRKKYHNKQMLIDTINSRASTQTMVATVAKARTPTSKKTEISELLPPQVTWLAPSIARSTVTEPLFRIRASLDSPEQLKKLRVLVNGKVQYTSRGMSLKSNLNTGPSQKATIDRDILLEQGENIIAIYAEDQNSGGLSIPRSITYEGKEGWLKPNLYMISIGISKYQDSEMDLEYADDDGRAMAKLFKSQQGKLYNQVTVRELYDEEATRDRIIDSLEWLEDETTQKDVALIFIAAHGLNDDQGKFYLLPFDGNSEKLRRTAVDWNDFTEVLGNLPSRVLFFLDTCHSGQLGENMLKLRGGRDNTEAIRELSSEENGVVVMAASTGKESSQEHPDWQHGAFTKALLEAMVEGKADYTGDNLVHLRELDMYISERVKQLTNGSQHPTTLKPSTISRLPIINLSQ
ncbi:MAG: hypothetical protein D6B25_19685 [Desulfobulbaceae bacterium]|nr:MAG: hypothetical protein D6B25_19685 [Desulfobulbaceae bacterium]